MEWVWFLCTCFAKLETLFECELRRGIASQEKDVAEKTSLGMSVKRLQKS